MGIYICLIESLLFTGKGTLFFNSKYRIYSAMGHSNVTASQNQSPNFIHRRKLHAPRLTDLEAILIG